jgi:hypothetical protein
VYSLSACDTLLPVENIRVLEEIFAKIPVLPQNVLRNFPKKQLMAASANLCFKSHKDEGKGAKQGGKGHG